MHSGEKEMFMFVELLRGMTRVRNRGVARRVWE
jgi:hypothetical protein